MKRVILDQLLGWKARSNRKPLILKGARQVGKSYSLREFGEKHFVQIHIFNFEKDPKLSSLFEADLDPRRIVRELALYQHKEICIETDLVFFDEIQAAPLALTSLKYFSEELPQLALCAAGSLLGLSLSGGSFPVGKVDFLELYPMSFFEFLEALGETQSLQELNKLKPGKTLPSFLHERLWELLKTYFIVGGLPEVVLKFTEQKNNLHSAFESARVLQTTLINSYIADMAKHSGKINSMHIERLWRNIPHQLARAQDGSASKFVFKGVLPSHNKYSQLVHVIDWLQAAGLIIRVLIVNRAELPLSAYSQESVFKLFLFDVGLLGALSGLAPATIWEYKYGTYKGYFAENFVAQELKALGISQIYSWREATAEVEFLLEREGKVLPVEVKSGHAIKSKSLTVFRKKYDPPRAVILSGRPYEARAADQVQKMPLYLASQV